MKVQVRRKFTLLLLFLLITALWSGTALSAGTPVVNPGTNPAAYHLGAVRFREFTSGGNEGGYLGVPDLDLEGSYRTQMNITWSSANQVAFSYDSALDKLTTSVDNGSSNWSLEYPNFSNNVRDSVFAGDQATADYAMGNLNYLQIRITLREKSPADISLDNVQLDGISLGDFPGKFRGTEYWHIEGYDFSDGFTLTGTLNLSGISSPSPDLNDVEISFGSIAVDAPIVYNVLTTPNPVVPETEITLTASVEDSGTVNIQSSEYNIESGPWSAMSAQDGIYDSPTEDVIATFNAPVSHGEYHVCVRGTNTDNNTGPEQCTVVSVDNQGPQTTYINVTPNPVTSGGEVTLSATIDDTLTGVSDIQSAEYNLDGGSWSAMDAQDGTYDLPDELVTITFTAPGTSGAINVCVRGMDAAGNTGGQSCTSLTIDNQGPITSAVVAAPNPVTPGALVTLTATVDDTSTGNSNIQSAQYQSGGQSWMPMDVQDGAFNSPDEAVTATLTAPDFGGDYDLCVRGWIYLGNTGAQTCTTLTVDNQGPLTSAVVAAPNPVTPGAQVAISAIVDDTTTGNSNIQSAEYQINGGTWTPMSSQDGSFDSPTENVITDFTVLKPPGDYDICVRGVDVLGNFGSSTCTQLTVSSTPTGSLIVLFPFVSKQVETTSQITEPIDIITIGD